MNGIGGKRTKAGSGFMALFSAFLLTSVFLAGCEEADLTVPNSAEVEDVLYLPWRALGDGKRECG